MNRLLTLLAALAIGACASMNPREVEIEYVHLNCHELMQAQWTRINQRMETEGRYYGGPGWVEWGVWGTAIFALAFTEPEATGPIIGAAARMRQAQVKAKMDALNLHIDILQAMYTENCR